MSSVFKSSQYELDDEFDRHIYHIDDPYGPVIKRPGGSRACVRQRVSVASIPYR
jgi:hypothetical protein